MKKTKIEIRAKFGSKFQEQFARDSLFGVLKAWKSYLDYSHKNNDVLVVINGNSVNNLDFFNWETYRKGQKDE